MKSARHILIFIPNLIAYTRLTFLTLSFLLMTDNFLFQVQKYSWIYASIFYILCNLLDALDGYTARKYHQVSKVGGLLDLMTDILATSCMCMVIINLSSKVSVLSDTVQHGDIGFFAKMTRFLYINPVSSNYTLFLQIWVFVNIAGHWGHQVASLSRGETSHKIKKSSVNSDLDPESEPLKIRTDSKAAKFRSIYHQVLLMYYKYNWGLALIVLMNELNFFCLWINTAKYDPKSDTSSLTNIDEFLQFLTLVTLPFMLLKFVIV